MSTAEDWSQTAYEQEQKILSRERDSKRLRTAHHDDTKIAAGFGQGSRIAVHGKPTVSPDSSTHSTSFSSDRPRCADLQSSSANSLTTENEKEQALSKADLSLVNKLLRSQLVNTTSDIEILRQDPNSPLYHVKSFSDLRLKTDLLRGVYDMGFNAPSKIQETALPALLADPPMNMIAQSQSGTGKTAAFVLTMLSRIDTSKAHPQCMCLAPTYELALQIADVTKRMAKFMPIISIGLVVRGQQTKRNVAIKDQIVIGTPGKMFDWCMKSKCIDLKNIQVFVLDEADVMIDTQGHADMSVRIQRALSKDCQLLLFSATYDKQIMKFAQTIVSNPMIISLKREEESLDTIRQYYIECPDLNTKFEALSNIYGSITIGQSMIFCRSKRSAMWLVEKMSGEGHAVGLLSGELNVEQRAAIINRFRAGKEKVLITTNVTARGIDVEQVSVVVNFDLPTEHRTGKVDCETYLHRIGRTGRFGKRGIAINMIDGLRSFRMMEQIEKHFGREIKKLDALNSDEIEKMTLP